MPAKKKSQASQPPFFKPNRCQIFSTFGPAVYETLAFSFLQKAHISLRIAVVFQHVALELCFFASTTPPIKTLLKNASQKGKN
jgi:hypothetical protein